VCVRECFIEFLSASSCVHECVDAGERGNERESERERVCTRLTAWVKERVDERERVCV